MTGAAGSEARPWRPADLALPAAAAGIALVYAPVLRALAAGWVENPYYSYGFLVPAFSGYLVWEQRRRLAGGGPAWSACGLPVAAVGLALLATGSAVASLTLQALSLPLVLGGLARCALDAPRSRALAFPIGFLGLMAPLPERLVSAVSLPLQYLAAWTAARALAGLGVPVRRDGLFLDFEPVVLHVGEACNGLRFLLAMIVVGVALAWATPGRLRGRAAVVVAAVAVAIAGNLVRVTGTALLAHYYGPEAAEGFFHVAYGKAVYAAMLLPLLALVATLRRRGGPPAPAQATRAGS